ncbi:MAG: hypothetical protein ACRDFT_00010 [bacterium]
MIRAIAVVTITVLVFATLALAPQLPSSIAQPLFGGGCLGVLMDTRGLGLAAAWLAFADAALLDQFGVGFAGNGREPLRYWEDGRPVIRSDYQPGADIEAVAMQMELTEVVLTFFLLATSPVFPIFMKMAIDRSVTVADRSCLWCRALDLFTTPTAHAQGISNAFMGPGMSEDVVLFAQIDGPGRGSMQRIVGTAAPRSSAGTVQVAGNRVTLRIPMAVAVEVGVARPGVRLVFGSVGPPPKSVYDRVPKQGSVQVGLRGQMDVDPGPMAKAKFDLAPGGRDVLYYLDTNGNGLIDAIARDSNGDGRISFLRSEGPVLLLGPGNQPVEFSEVQEKTAGNRRAFLAVAGQVAYLTVMQDLNGDGDVSDEGEFRSYLLRR